jgi:hypothetical protein
MLNPTANPFLTRDTYQTEEDAISTYLQTLDEQSRPMQPIDWLERVQLLSSETLDKLWGTALETATAGNVQGGIALLASMLTEWARYKALEYLIQTQESLMALDMWDPITYDRVRQEFQQTSANQVVYLATQLHNALVAGQADREQKQQDARVQTYIDMHSYNWQLIGRQDSRLEQAHQLNLQYAQSAFDGVKQAQQSVYWMREGVQEMYQFVQGHEANMVGGMQALQAHLEQNLPSYIESAHRGRTTHFLVWFLIICGIGVGLFALAGFIATHLVGG